MADITMCASKNCPIRASCYRTRAKVSEFQSWADFHKTCNENFGYIDYIPIIPKKNENIIKMNS